jgi:hypothetical protein
VAGLGQVPVAGCEAGIPPEDCGEGFEADGTMGCRALLPEEPCASGTLAIPGESSCRELVPCGSGKWGDAPLSPSTIFVDARYAGLDSDGTETKPFKTIGAAVAVATAGSLIAVADGVYAEDVTIDRTVKLWGRCPTMVEIRGTTAPALASLAIHADATEIHHLAVAGNADGVFVSNGEGVTFDGVWIHDTHARGIGVQPDFGPASVVVHNSIVERARLVGVHVIGSHATVDASSFRGVLENDPYATGYGLSVQPDMNSGAASELSLSASVIEANHTAGVLVVGSLASITQSVIRTTEPSMLSSRDGVGIIAQESNGLAASLTLETSLLAANHSRGLALVGSEATLRAVHVRDTEPQEWDQNTGEGVAIINSGGQASKALIEISTFERNHQSGIFVRGSSATLAKVLVRDTEPRGADGAFGRGLAVVGEPAERLMANAEVQSCLFENNYAFGVWLADARATIDGTMIRGTKAQSMDGEFGDGIAVATLALDLPQTVELQVTTSRSEHNARAGLAVHGAHASVASSSFECNDAFDLLGLATYFNVSNQFVVDDAGQNACGCASNRRECTVEAP